MMPLPTVLTQETTPKAGHCQQEALCTALNKCSSTHQHSACRQLGPASSAWAVLFSQEVKLVPCDFCPYHQLNSDNQTISSLQHTLHRQEEADFGPARGFGYRIPTSLLRGGISSNG